MSVLRWSPRRRNLAVLLPLLLVGMVSALLIAIRSFPFPWIGLMAGAWCLWGGFVFRPWARWGINLAVGLFTLAVLEASTPKNRPGVIRHTSLDVANAPFFTNEDLLGYVPRPNSRTRHRLTTNGRSSFDVVYTVDDQSLRVVVPPGSPASDTIVFCGCSFTFGEGVEDDESLPWQVAARRPDLRVLNFGFSGYGPHQMLANLESERIGQICGKAPRAVIYQMIPDHVRRVTGWIPYGEHSPRYEWIEGEVRRAGRLDDLSLARSLRMVLWKSRLFARYAAPRIRIPGELELTTAIIERSAAEVARQFPGCEFHVLYWHEHPEILSIPLLNVLKKTGLKIHVVEDFAPELEIRTSRYRIPDDYHPSAAAYTRLADYVCREILPPAQDGDSGSTTEAATDATP